MVVHAAFGGSTNLILHVPAIAYAAGLFDTFRTLHPDQKDAYTWWTHWANARARNVGWRIDYWVASNRLKDIVRGAHIHPDVMGSDHCPVSIEIDA